jgi:hypothetical protein
LVTNISPKQHLHLLKLTKLFTKSEKNGIMKLTKHLKGRKMMKKLLLFLLIFILSSALLISCDLFELPDGNDDGSGEGSGSGSGSGNGGGLGGGIFGEGGFGEGEGSGEGEGGSESTFTVTFNTDGGSAVQSQNVLPGGNATQPQDPTKNGYVFDCWVLETAMGEMVWEFDMPITQIQLLKVYFQCENPLL